GGGEQLEDHTEDDEGEDGVVIQQSHQGAAKEPGNAVDAVEGAESAAAFIHGNDLGDAGAERSVLRTDADGPATDAGHSGDGSAEETQRQGKEREHDSQAENGDAVAVE